MDCTTTGRHYDLKFVVIILPIQCAAIINILQSKQMKVIDNHGNKNNRESEMSAEEQWR
jgi:hypothetical protein